MLEVMGTPPVAADRIYSCSQAQKRFWFEEQLHPGNPGLNVAVRWRIEGTLSSEIVEAAWRTLVARHGSLRTFFCAHDGEVVQVVRSHVPFDLAVVDFTQRDDPEAEAARLADREAHASFDLGCAPLLRVSHVRLSAGVATLLVTAHHTVCDGWSIGILAREMAELCAAMQAGEEKSLPRLPLSYGEHAAREGDAAEHASLDAEAERLHAILADYRQFELLPDRPRPPVQTSNGRILSRLLERDVTDRLATLARENGCTLFIAAFAALLVLLQRHSGEKDIALGTQVVGRDDPDLEDVVGCFINTIVLRGDLRGEPTFLEVLERAREAAMDVFDLRHVPLERLIEIVNPTRDLSRNALFSINFIFQRSFVNDANYDRFALLDLPSRSAGSLYDLNFFMVERPDGWRASCEYNADLFDDATIANVLDRFARLLRGIVMDPSQRIGDLPLLGEAERRAAIVDANRTVVPYPADATVTHLIAEQTARTPNAPAVACGQTTLTYAELEMASNRLARHLLECVPASSRVGVLLERSTDLVVALLAVLKAGCSYVPLDPGYPPHRLRVIARDAGLAATITHSALREWPDAFCGTRVLLDADEARIGARSGAALGVAPRPADVAYAIFTSGSTGSPKGVEIPHRALANLLCAMSATPGIAAGDVMLAVTTVAFDIAALELFLPLISGASVVVAREEEVRDGAALLALLRESGATILQATPATWQLLLASGWRGNPRLTMLVGGEALSPELASRLLACGGALWNMYGPTETTIWSSVLRIERSDGAIHIGGPIANTQFYVLDGAGRLVPPGSPGELYIGGVGVAIGYLDRPELTRERFVADPFAVLAGARMYRTGDVVRARAAGTFEFLGRTDQQVKVRGFRIELGEIETALAAHPDAREAAAAVFTDSSGEKTLCAFVVPFDRTTDAVALAASLRTHAERLLPGYMVPAPIVVVPSLPRTANGKLDRAALAFPHVDHAADAGGDEPLTDTERTLATIVADVLERRPGGRSADLFALGLHSLLAVRLTARVSEAFSVQVPLRTLFHDRTVAALAARIDGALRENSSEVVSETSVTLNAQGERPPFISIHDGQFIDSTYYSKLAAAIGPSQPIHVEIPFANLDARLWPTIEAMAKLYLPRIVAFQPHGPYRIGGFCMSGLIAFEVARLLRQAGHQVDDVVLINSSALPPRAIPAFDRALRAIGLNVRLPLVLRQSLCFHLARLHEATVIGPGSVLRTIGVRLAGMARRALAAGRHRFANASAGARLGETPLSELWMSNLVASLTYHSKPYDGRITLVWASDRSGEMKDPTVGWGASVRDVRVRRISGTHTSPLHETVDELVDVVAALLAEEVAS